MNSENIMSDFEEVFFARKYLENRVSLYSNYCCSILMCATTVESVTSKSMHGWEAALHLYCSTVE